MSHSAIAALLGAAGGSGGDPEDTSGADPTDPVTALQQCIQDLHELMTLMPDAKHTQQIHQALAPLLSIQSEFAKANQSDPRQKLLQQLGQ